MSRSIVLIPTSWDGPIPLSLPDVFEGCGRSEECNVSESGLAGAGGTLGRAEVSNKRAHVTDELNTAVRDASASYELTFAAAEGDRVNEYHALDVRVDKPNVKVRTTAGYYAHVAPLTR